MSFAFGEKVRVPDSWPCADEVNASRYDMSVECVLVGFSF